MVSENDVTSLHGSSQRRAEHKIDVLVDNFGSALVSLFYSKGSYLWIHVIEIEPFLEPFGFLMVIGGLIFEFDVGSYNIKVGLGVSDKIKHGWSGILVYKKS